jgi:hypothetical protein
VFVVHTLIYTVDRIFQGEIRSAYSSSYDMCILFSDIISPVKDKFSEDLLPPEIHVKVQ